MVLHNKKPGREKCGDLHERGTFSSANLPPSQGDRHPALPIISLHHLSRPLIALAIIFPLEVSSAIDGGPPPLAWLN